MNLWGVENGQDDENLLTDADVAHVGVFAMDLHTRF